MDHWKDAMRPWLSSCCLPHVKLPGYKQTNKKMNWRITVKFLGTEMVIWLCWKKNVSLLEKHADLFVHEMTSGFCFKINGGGGNFPSVDDSSSWFVNERSLHCSLYLCIYVTFSIIKIKEKNLVICVSFPFAGLFSPFLLYLHMKSKTH